VQINQNMETTDRRKRQADNKTEHRGRKIDMAGRLRPAASQPNPSQNQHKSEVETKHEGKREEKTGKLRSVALTGAEKPISRSRRSGCYLIMSNARGALSLRRLGDATSVPIAWTSTEPGIKNGRRPPQPSRLPSPAARQSLFLPSDVRFRSSTRNK
jgi:hypothetical protein